MTYLAVWLVGIPVAAAVLDRISPDNPLTPACAVSWPASLPLVVLMLLAIAGARLARRLRREVPRG